MSKKDFIDSIENGIEDMKCCGNCRDNGIIEITEDFVEDNITRTEICNRDPISKESGYYCNKWKFDGRGRKDRQI